MTHFSEQSPSHHHHLAKPPHHSTIRITFSPKPLTIQLTAFFYPHKNTHPSPNHHPGDIHRHFPTMSTKKTSTPSQPSPLTQMPLVLLIYRGSSGRSFIKKCSLNILNVSVHHPAALFDTKPS